MNGDNSKINVLIVEDSMPIRMLLEHIIGRDSRFAVAGSVASAEAALRCLPRVRPDVISLDIRLPGMNGFEATKRIMTEQPTPIVVVSASVEADDLNISMNALKAGALAVVEKPVGVSSADYDRLAESLCTHLATMSEVRVVRQRFNRPPIATTRGDTARFALSYPVAPPPAAPPKVIGMVASTGGPRAVQTILSNLPVDFPVPIVLVQHIATSFHEGFVRWLDGIVPIEVVTAQARQTLEAGRVYVAPADRHLRVERGRFAIDRSPPVCSERPSGTVLLESLARSYGSDALGVVLTGMGSDGAVGLARLRESGGYTIAEDLSTAVVYGMPAAAVELGGVNESLPLEMIAPRLLELAMFAGVR